MSPRSAHPHPADDVIRQVLGLVESGGWPFGTRIPSEPELAHAFGVDPEVVRQAVRALEAVGALATHPGDGTSVRLAVEEEVALARRARETAALEALEVRAFVERDATALAALRRDGDDLAAIDAALRAQRRAYEATDVDAYVAADIALHVAIIGATHNDLLVQVYGSFLSAVGEVVAVAVGNAVVHGLPAPHEALVAAVREGDPSAAGQAAADVLAAAGRRIRGEE